MIDPETVTLRVPERTWSEFRAAWMLYAMHPKEGRGQLIEKATALRNEAEEVAP